ncbi:type II secretion system protein [Vibrio sp. 404]|uniref:Type II secretion system protein n=1 Tax=Vibrio marinisediminis TaxID=2758441 RepID=A0A7W2FQ46_9VIBR|nr:type II secretion system protein [Vibrio marinisediminis]MBA5762109.1 type II secretion system protein [Vibrio marinisediminis]
MNKRRGFTLIESIVVMVVMAFAMVTITSFLMPQVASSADPHYQSRASALGQSVMTKILARKFDHNNSAGGEVRCSLSGATACRALGIDTDLGETATAPDLFNDVDDYRGCWTPNGTSGCNNLYDLISSGEDSSYHNFRLDIDVVYAVNTSTQMVKKITLKIAASDQTPIEYVAYRGNY